MPAVETSRVIVLKLLESFTIERVLFLFEGTFLSGTPNGSMTFILCVFNQQEKQIVLIFLHHHGNI